MTSSERLDRSFLSLRVHLGSIAHLLAGNVANAAIMLVSVAMAAQALGPEQYGVMVLVLAFGRTIERLIRFESWQPVIKFAAEESCKDENESKNRLSRLYCYGLLLDISSALTAAAIIAGTGYLAGAMVGLDAGYSELVIIYSLAIALNITGMPTASLRFAGRFRTIAYGATLSNVLPIVLALIGVWMGAGLLGFIVIWTLAQIIGSLFFLWLGLRALSEQNIPSPFRARISGLRKEFPGFLSFAWSTNLSTALRTLSTEADALLVGALAGAAPAGFYNLAKRMAKVAAQVGGMTQAVLYPDMARMWARERFENLRHLTLRVQLVLAGTGFLCLLVAALFGKWIIDIAFGEEYAPSFNLLLAQLVAVIFLMHGAPSRSVLLAMGRPDVVLNLAAVGTVAFFAVSWVLIPHIGAMGAVCGQIALAAVTAAGMDLVWRRGVVGRTAQVSETG